MKFFKSVYSFTLNILSFHSWRIGANLKQKDTWSCRRGTRVGQSSGGRLFRSSRDLILHQTHYLFLPNPPSGNLLYPSLWITDCPPVQPLNTIPQVKATILSQNMEVKEAFIQQGIWERWNQIYARQMGKIRLESR